MQAPLLAGTRQGMLHALLPRTMATDPNIPDPNSDLLSRVALRDRTAFQQLYQQTAPHLNAVVLRICRDRGLSEEAVQEAYIQIWNKAGEFNPERARASTWMTAIARYRALDVVRKRRREVPLDDKAETLVDPREVSGDPRLEGRLQECLNELEGEQRDAVVMAYVEGYTHSELSDRLQSPLGTVKSWVRRGLLQLRECLGVAA